MSETQVPRIPCIICRKQMKHVDEECNQPYKGLSFTSRGQFGSTAFDPMDSTWIEINICDDCIRERKDCVLHGKQQRRIPTPVDYEIWEGQ